MSFTQPSGGFCPTCGWMNGWVLHAPCHVHWRLAQHPGKLGCQHQNDHQVVGKVEITHAQKRPTCCIANEAHLYHCGQIRCPLLVRVFLASSDDLLRPYPSQQPKQHEQGKPDKSLLANLLEIDTVDIMDIPWVWCVLTECGGLERLKAPPSDAILCHIECGIPSIDSA